GGTLVLGGAGHPMTALLRIVFRKGRWRPRRRGIGHVAALLAMLAAADAARADDWQACISALPNQVLAPCSAVISQRAREPVDLSRAYVRRGEWYRRNNRFDEAWADMDEAEKLDPNSYNAIVGHGPLLMQKGKVEEARDRYERAMALD